MEITPNKIPSIVCQIIIGKVCRKQIAKNKVNVNFEFLNKILKSVSIPVIAEGKIDTPEKAKRVLEIGADASSPLTGFLNNN